MQPNQSLCTPPQAHACWRALPPLLQLPLCSMLCRTHCCLPNAKPPQCTSTPQPHTHTTKQGFRAQDPELDDLVRAAGEIGARSVAPDASLTAEENVELLLRALRVAQLGLEAQVADNDGLLREADALRGELRGLEDANRGLQAEVGELRALQDAARGAGDAREAARELRVRFVCVCACVCVVVVGFAGVMVE